MIPILHSSALIIPGQLGPISRLFDWALTTDMTRTMSCCGTPSVIHTIKGISAFTASIMASATIRSCQIHVIMIGSGVSGVSGGGGGNKGNVGLPAKGGGT